MTAVTWVNVASFIIGTITGALCMRVLWERANTAAANYLRLVIARHLLRNTEAAKSVEGAIMILEGKPDGT